MGAQTFMQEAGGKDARDAFSQAISHARYEYGHGGYTGHMTTTELMELAKRLSDNHGKITAEGVMAAFEILDEELRERQRLDDGEEEDEVSLDDFEDEYEQENCIICGAIFAVLIEADTVMCPDCTERRRVARKPKHKGGGA